jgi:hypothetical protein
MYITYALRAINLLNCMEIGKQDTGLRSYAVKCTTIDIDFLAYFS